MSLELIWGKLKKKSVQLYRLEYFIFFFYRNNIWGKWYYHQRWEFIKENKENTLSTRKATKKKEKKRNHVLEQETDQEKKKVFFFFSWSLSWSRACFLSSFFLFSWSLSWSKACFLVFFYKFPTQYDDMNLICEHYL